MKFEYTEIEDQLIPIVPIKIKCIHEYVELLCVIDTGATFSIFPADVAEILGIRLEDGQETEIVCGDGNTLRTYVHILPASIAGKEFSAHIGFSKGLGASFNVMGRRDIFDKFTICFHEKEGYIEFT